MFENLTPRPPDAIIALMELAKADTRAHKIDLGVGVYKATDGSTPIMRAVKRAEQSWHGEETTKSYVSTLGNAGFCERMLDIILGETHPARAEGRVARAQATGGSGALRLGAELIMAASPEANVWVPTPTWANHIPLIGSVGFTLREYPYYNRETLGVDFDDMVSMLKAEAKPGDVVILHGCCHNPTGADLSHAQWDKLSELLPELELTPFVDLAYFGLGRGLEDDTYGLRKLIETCPELIFAASCSKNFALYKERVGLVSVVANTAEAAKIAQSQFGAIQRKLVSMPPDHGAALVSYILGDAELKAEWISELTHMRERMIGLREQLADALNVQGGEHMARAIRNQIGMFSTLPLSKEQVSQLREDHAVYMLNSGRMNVAAANAENIPRLATAILDVI